MKLSKSTSFFTCRWRLRGQRYAREEIDQITSACTALAAVSPIVTRRHVRSTTYAWGAHLSTRTTNRAWPWLVASGRGRTGSCLSCPGSTATCFSISMPKRKLFAAAQSRAGDKRNLGGQLPCRSRRKLGESCLGVVRPAGLEILTGRPPAEGEWPGTECPQHSGSNNRSSDGERGETRLDRT